MRFVGVTTAVGVLVISLQVDLGNLDTTYAARMTRRLLAATVTGVCLAGLLAALVSLPPSVGSGPWLERGVGVWLAVCWFATATLAFRRAHAVVWAQRMWPVLLTLGFALVMRVGGSYDAPELLIGSALLVMVAGAVTLLGDPTPLTVAQESRQARLATSRLRVVSAGPPVRQPRFGAALELGASGVLAKTTGFADLLDAIIAGAQGRDVLTHERRRELLSELHRARAARSTDLAGLPG